MDLTKEELFAIALVVEECARLHQEDLAGVFTKLGTFHFLQSDGVEILAKKIEGLIPEAKKERAQKLQAWSKTRDR